MPLGIGSTNTLLQSPAPVVYKGGLKAVVNEMLTSILGVSVNYTNYIVNGIYPFRKAIVNDSSYFDCQQIVESNFGHIKELEFEGFVSNFHKQIESDINISSTGYWFQGNDQFFTPTTLTTFKALGFENGTDGIDLTKSVKIINSITGFAWMNTAVQLVNTAIPLNTKLVAYYDGVRTVIGDVFDTDNIQLRACSLKIPYSFIPLGVKKIRLTIENSVTLDILCDTGERDLQVFNACEGFNDIMIGYLDSFNRWNNLPIINYKKENANPKKDAYDISISFMDYTDLQFKNNRRDKYIESSLNKSIDLESDFLTDKEFEEYKEVINSPYHYVFIDGIRYFATLKTNSWSESRIFRDKLKTFKLTFDLQDEII